MWLTTLCSAIILNRYLITMIQTCKSVFFILLSLIILFDYLGTGNNVSSEVVSVKGLAKTL